MKRVTTILLLTFFLLASSAAIAQENWKRLIDAPTFGFAVNPYNSSSIIVGGKGRRLYFTTDGGKTWRQDSIEFTTASTQFTNVFIHPLDTNIIIVGGINFGSIRRSTDGGKSWSIVFEPELGGVVLNGESMMTAPHNPEHIYFTRLNPPLLYKSTDRGATWDTVSSIPKVNPDDPNELDPGLCTIAFRRDSSNIILAGTTGGRIYKSTDTGNTWRPMPRLANYIYGDAEIPKIIFSKEDPLTGYTVVAYFYPLSLPNGGVYKTRDGGNSWQLLAFADTSLWSVGVPAFGTPDEVAVGGFSVPVSEESRVPGNSVVGILKDGQNWKRYDQEVPWTPNAEHNVWLLKYEGRTPQTQKIYMATEAGFFAKDGATVGIAAEELLKAHQYKIVAENSILSVEFSVPLTEEATLEVADMLGRTVIKATIEQGNNPARIHLPVKLPAGAYIVRLLKTSLPAQLIIIE